TWIECSGTSAITFHRNHPQTKSFAAGSSKLGSLKGFQAGSRPAKKDNRSPIRWRYTTAVNRPAISGYCEDIRTEWVKTILQRNLFWRTLAKDHPCCQKETQKCRS